MTRATLLFLAVSWVSLSAANAEIAVDSSSENNLRLIYTPDDGNLELLVSPDTPLTILRLRSEASLFTGDTPPVFEGIFDFYNEDTIFKLDPAGFGSIPSFGNIGAGRKISDVALDLTAGGAMLGSGGFDTVGGIFIVPEPNLAIIAPLVCLLYYRKRKQS